eukprot:325328_1
MGSVVGFERHATDPNNVWIPPNLSGFNRVVLSLPNELEIGDVLTDLVDHGYLNGVEEHDKVEEEYDTIHYILKRSNEKQTNELINYINNKFGYIADKGYVKPSRNIVISNNKYGSTTTDVAKSQHVALIQSPIGANPNEQFSAYRRELDPQTEFPKFERVDIEDVINYTRPNENHLDMNNHAKNALDAMTKGAAFDTRETQVLKDREAVTIDYVEKVRKLRMELKNTKLRRLKNYKNQRKIRAQFKYDHMNNLIDLKQRKYAVNRAKCIYKTQLNERLKIAKMKQIIDRNVRQTEYNQHQSTFWKDFDSNK